MGPKRNNKKTTKQVYPKSNNPQSSVGDQSPAKNPAVSQSDQHLLQLYQDLLDCITSAFPQLLSLDAVTNVLPKLLQEVKGHLYNRDFVAAFSRQDYLEAYAVRWSASRALGYLHIFEEVFEHLNLSNGLMGHLVRSKSGEDGDDRTDMQQVHTPPLKVKCLGGGAGELCALAGLYKSMAAHDSEPRTSSDFDSVRGEMHIAVGLVDVADWSLLTNALHSSLTSSRTLSQYASEAAKAANQPLVDPNFFHCQFYQQDVLTWDDHNNESASWKALVDSNLITIMFTLNELYGVSLVKTQKLLLKLAAALRLGTLILVVDSPGSYSTVAINGSEKRYPMNWLLDHTLLNPLTPAPRVEDCENESMEPVHSRRYESNGQHTASKAELKPLCEKVISRESEWFRLPPGLRYPLELENMRYQIHLYRRL